MFFVFELSGASLTVEEAWEIMRLASTSDMNESENTTSYCCLLEWRRLRSEAGILVEMQASRRVR